MNSDFFVKIIFPNITCYIARAKRRFKTAVIITRIGDSERREGSRIQILACKGIDKDKQLLGLPHDSLGALRSSRAKQFLTEVYTVFLLPVFVYNFPSTLEYIANRNWNKL